MKEDEAARKKLAVAVTAHEEANKRAQEVARKYEIKKITSFPARIISKGTVKVLNWLSSLGRKKK